jgi:hypothetical protein
MCMKIPVSWKDVPEEHNYPAAKSYLALIFDTEQVDIIVQDLKKSTVTEFKAKDIFRASKLSLLGISNSHVEKNLKKITDFDALSPILLVRDIDNHTVIIADGYHRMCAVYHFNEDALIPCKIVTP